MLSGTRSRHKLTSNNSHAENALRTAEESLNQPLSNPYRDKGSANGSFLVDVDLQATKGAPRQRNETELRTDKVLERNLAMNDHEKLRSQLVSQIESLPEKLVRPKNSNAPRSFFRMPQNLRSLSRKNLSPIKKASEEAEKLPAATNTDEFYESSTSFDDLDPESTIHSQVKRLTGVFMGSEYRDVQHRSIRRGQQNLRNQQ